ncbi:hypothetical protein [Hymenobacter jeollabukensis]|uniref:T9SS type A sorting domain-containing protein n=1 Tax=Hymenobacter jeollabukensis TaxID=2025313 RepID=A0A5R8WL77_9BACT|nr:hypothetical protein [Hymenobacter jeollabukensis]TLM89983.1 hypothetical protein FDY95_18335 [Hymenobacter jeollabukensis]
MRPNLYPLAFLLLGAAPLAQAQTSPSIDRTDLPVIGDTLRLSQAAPALPASAPPLTRRGANQTWNYAALTPTAQRVERYANINTTATTLQFAFGPFGGVNRATLVSPQTLPALGAGLPITDPVEFYNLSNADFRSVGFGATVTGFGLPVTYQSQALQDVIYRFPLSYNSPADSSNSFFETPAVIASTGYLSQRRKRVNRPDAWGTLTTPFGTFQTVRVVTRIEDHDSLAVGGTSGQGLTLPVRREYKWLAKTIHVPVLTITTNVVNGQEVITNVEYRDIYRRIQLPTAAAAGKIAAPLTAWPTAAEAGTAVQLQLPATAEVEVTDLTGRLLGRFEQPKGASALPLNAAWQGTLLLRVRQADGATAVGKVVRY